VPGVFTPVLAKHSKSFSLIDCISVGVDRMQRNFEPMRKQVEAWQRSELTDVTAKVVIYEAFVEGKLEAPKHLARSVHDLYFEPKYEEFRPRTIWSLSNAFTSAFKELDPIPQFHSSRPQRSWANSWKLGSHNRSNQRGGGVCQPPLPNKAIPLCKPACSRSTGTKRSTSLSRPERCGLADRALACHHLRKSEKRKQNRSCRCEPSPTWDAWFCGILRNVAGIALVMVRASSPAARS
jgi:hypothetical protein